GWARDQDGGRVRIGIATGEVLARVGAQPHAGEGMAAGDVLITARRLGAAASPNAILVGEQAYRATKHQIDYREAEPVAAKDNQMADWEALLVRSRLKADDVHGAKTERGGRARDFEQHVYP